MASNLVDRVKELAARQGFSSIRQVAIKAGIGENSIYRWNTSKPSTRTLDKVAKVLGVTTAELVSDSDRNVPSELDLEHAADNAMTFGGKPITDEDREITKALLRSYFENKK